MPILDLKVWTEEREDGGKDVQFEFYRKPFASKYTMLASSAAPWQLKRTVLTQEGIRRLLRCRPGLPAGRKIEIMNEFMMMMKRSGYDEKFRLEILKSVKNGHAKIVEDDAKGEKPMYRGRMWRRTERFKAKQNKQRGWHRKDGHSSVIFVPHTPGGKLAKTMRNTMERIMGGQRGGMKIVEQVGMSVASMLQKSDPWKEKSCQRAECVVCKHGGQGDCGKESVRYRVTCVECKDEHVYEGETSANGYYRGKLHTELYHSKSRPLREKSFMWKHSEDKHEGRCVDFKMDILQQYIEDPMGRQINEGVWVQHTEIGRLLNSGGEWRLAHVPRLNPSHN
jgi:hypothetical protein